MSSRVFRQDAILSAANSALGSESRELVHYVTDDGSTLADTTDDFRFAAAVTAFGLILRDSKYAGSADYPLVRDLARSALGRDERGRRAEFLKLVADADYLSDRRPDTGRTR